jgi:CO dehydrogenase nickel-insertion accessory protein CooC1
VKIAIAGKGGAGKTFIAANLARLFAEYEGAVNNIGKTYALDADPCGGLNAALGMPQSAVDGVKPLADMRDFIKPGEDDGALYLSGVNAGAGLNVGANGETNLNANVNNGEVAISEVTISEVSTGKVATDDDATSEVTIGEVGTGEVGTGDCDRYSYLFNGVRYLRMARVKPAGAGCYCDEHAFLQAMMNSMLLDEDDIFLLDLSAGVEPFARGALNGVDMLLIVSEATRACIETTKLMRSLAADSGVVSVYVAANKIRNEKEEILIRASFHRDELIGLIRMSDAVADFATGVGTGRNPVPPKASADIVELFNHVHAILQRRK